MLVAVFQTVSYYVIFVRNKLYKHYNDPYFSCEIAEIYVDLIKFLLSQIMLIEVSHDIHTPLFLSLGDC